MQDQKNLFLAMLLSGIVMFGYYFFYAMPLRKQAQADLEREQAQAAQTAEVEAVEAAGQAPDLSGPKGQRIDIDTASFKGSFLTTGTRFDDIALKDYQNTLDPADGNFQILSPQSAERSAYIMDNWTGRDAGQGSETPWTLISGSKLTESNNVVLGYTGEGFTVERTVSVDDKFLITLTDKVTNTSPGEKTLIRKGVSRQHELPDDLTNFFIIQEGPIAILDSEYTDMKYKGIKKKGSWSENGESGWVGLADKYWLNASIAPQGKQMTAKFDFKSINGQDVYETSYELAPETLSAGTSIESVGYIYVGAKERDVLNNYQKAGISEMERAIDWGLMRIIVRPLSTMLSYFGSMFGNYGVAVLLLTLIIKIVLFPLFNKQYASQAKMKKVQPKLKKLQELYKDDRMALQKEMMALYRKEGVNPVAGCLPVIPTIFVFFALYKTVFINVDMRHAPFFGWIKDLSARDPLSILNGFGILPWDAIPAQALSIVAIGPLAILYALTMSAMYTLTPPSPDPTQARIFKWMPWIFMVVLAGFPAALLLYWVWNNVLSFLQQYYITRKFKVDTPVDAFFRKLTKKDDPASTSE